MTKIDSIKDSSLLQANKRKATRSELSEFIERPLPSEKEVKKFDSYLKNGRSSQMVSDSLSKIYEGDNGERVNVQEVNIKRRRNIWLRIGSIIFYIAIAGGIIAGVYIGFFKNTGTDSSLQFAITADQAIQANQEFTYTLDYSNQENIVLTNLELTVVYPDNFILTDTFPAASRDNNKWSLPNIRTFSSGQVKIRGRLIGPSGQSNVLFADLTYQPEGITSSFKKSASIDTVLVSSGLDIVTSAPGSVLIGEDSVATVSWLPQEKNSIDHFTIRLEKNDNVSLLKSDLPDGVTSDEDNVWSVASITNKEPLAIKFKVNDKNKENEELKLSFEYTPENSSKSYIFDTKTISIEIIKNSLNLSITANGQSSDQGIDFGQTINYSISYANKGEVTMSNVIITAVIDSDALDWRNLEDTNHGRTTSSTIMWTGDEIPDLKSLAKDQQGTIEFTVPVRPTTEAKLISRFEIQSYAQFALGGVAVDQTNDNQANRSNQLTLKINSDINLDEAVRYFDEDNIGVGTGPLPPKVGETTTVKVYWTIKNNLHEISGLRVATTLPSGVTWDFKDQASVGSLQYDSITNQVIWEIGRLPLSVPLIKAEFSIALKPRASDFNKIMILASGTTLVGQDNQTTFPINKVLKAQTTKLEKDDIANTDGIVQ
ncbi:MAG TPA: hypothetical protein PK720_00235 [bacterium]|nr:hypothetical protein [bacterium]